MELQPMCKIQSKKERFINLDHTRTLVEANPEYKQLIHLPDNRSITNKNIDQVIDVFQDEIGDDLQYMVCSKLNIENMQININIVPIVESA